ncbi:MAG TPA: hypothetical protein VL527_08205 [Dongiaceae bacterium]|nr:hypothetical protein [Dongiaceae bacterium]
MFALCAWSGTAAVAAVCTNSASVTGYTIIDAGPYSTVRYETTSVRKVMPLVSDVSTNAVQVSNSSGQSLETYDASATNTFTASSHFQGAGISGYAAAQAGSAHAWARNSAVAAPPAILTPDGAPYLPSPYTVIAHIDVTAQSWDSLTIQSATLTNGTPITFTWNMYMEGTALNTGYQPGNVGGSYIFPLNLQAGFGFGSLVQVFGNGRDFGGFQGNFYLPADLLVTVKVGDVIPIYSDIALFGDAYVDAANSANSPPWQWSASGSVNMANTAGMWFSDLPADVQLSSASGFDYTVQPQPPVVVPPDAPVLTAHYLPLDSQVEFSWNSQTNVVYQPQFLPFFGAVDWVDFGAPIAGNGSTTNFIDTVDPAQVERLFRLVIVP